MLHRLHQNHLLIRAVDLVHHEMNGDRRIDRIRTHHHHLLLHIPPPSTHSITAVVQAITRILLLTGHLDRHVQMNLSLHQMRMSNMIS